MAALVCREGSRPGTVRDHPLASFSCEPQPCVVSSYLNAKTSHTVQRVLIPALLYVVRGHASLTSKVAKGSKGEIGSAFFSLLPLASREQGTS